MKGIERRFTQIHALGQIQIVNVLQAMPQGRIDLCFAGGRVENVLVSHAALFAQLDGQQKQWRMNSFVLSFLEVVPAEKNQDEPKLGKSELGFVAARFADDLVQD